MKLGSRQSGWGIVLLFFSAAMIWVFTTPNPKEASRFYQNVMAMSNAAFQQAIIFAHLKYHASADKGAKKIDLIEIAGKGLDFNQEGFPVGTEHDENSVQLPISRRDCRDLWQTLLAPMRPYLSPTESASLDVNARQGKCVFTSVLYTEQRIIYDPKSGKVSLQVL